MPDPNYAGRLSFMDVLDALDAMQQKPTILVIQQKWPDEHHQEGRAWPARSW